MECGKSSICDCICFTSLISLALDVILSCPKQLTGNLLIDDRNVSMHKHRCTLLGYCTL